MTVFCNTMTCLPIVAMFEQKLAYARQILRARSLIPDHTAFSWTPSTNNYIYCAWLSEVFFYGFWQKLGPRSWAFRYLVVAGAMGLLALFARRLGLLTAPLTWLALLSAWIGRRHDHQARDLLVSPLSRAGCVYFGRRRVDRPEPGNALAFSIRRLSACATSYTWGMT